MDARFVVLSDLHAHPWAAFARGDGLGNSRLQRSLALLEASLLRARTEEATWLFVGDLVHTAGYALNTVLGGVAEVLARYPDVPKMAVWGNHDARGVGGLITVDQTVWAALTRNLPNFTLLHSGMSVETQGLTLVGEGYQPRLELLTFGGKGADLALYHQTVHHSATATGFLLDEGLDAAELFQGARVTLVGHVHHPQQHDAPAGQLLLVPGSPEHHNFGDQGAHGWWVLTVPEVKSQAPVLEFVPGGSPEFRTVDSVAEVCVGDGHYYRVRQVGAGEAVPAGVAIIAPAASTVSARDVLQGVGEVEAILQAWMTEHPPEGEPEAYIARGRALLEDQDPLRLRPLRLRSLVLHNFGSHAHSELAVRDGTWLVVGEGKDFPSNGAGKSTLWEALFWLLFGRNTKGQSADEVVRWSQTECWVEAQLVGDDAEAPLLLRRSRGRTGHQLVVREGDVELWGAASVGDMTTKLGKYLGITPEIFQSLCYFSQEKLVLFSSATDGERKDVLADLMGLSAYQKASAAAAADVAVAEKAEASQESWADAHRTLLTSERERLLANRAARDVWDAQQATRRHPVQARLAALSDPTLLLRARLPAFFERWEAGKGDALRRVEALGASLVAALHADWARGLDVQRTALQQQLDVCWHPVLQKYGDETRIQALLDALPVAVARVEEYRALEEEAQRQLHRADTYRVSTLGAEERSLLAEKKRADDALTYADKTLGEGQCPTCHQAVSADHRDHCLAPLRETQREIVVRIADLGARKRQAQDECCRYDEALTIRSGITAQAQATVEEWTALVQVMQGVAVLRQQLRDLQARVDDLGSIARKQAEEELARQRQKVNERFAQRRQRVESFLGRVVRQYQDTRSGLEQELGRLDAEPNPYTVEWEGIETRLREAERALQRSADTLDQVRARKAIGAYWKHGFSRQGIQSLLVEEIAVRFNRNRGTVFPVLTQGVFDVQFSTLSQTAAGEWRERTEFSVTQHGQAIPYGALSGGQKRRIDLGILLVLATSVAEWMGVPGVLGLLILDEALGFLDASGAEGLVEALASVQERIPALYVITHDTHLQSLFPEVVRVKQDAEGVSRVEGFQLG